MSRITLSMSLVAIICGVNSASAADVSEKAVAVMKKYCFKCHGEEKQIGRLRLDTASYFRRGGDSGEPLLVSGDLGNSYFWTRVGVDTDMPPEDEPQPSAEERELLKQWLLAGAQYPQAEKDDSYFKSLFSSTANAQTPKETVAQTDVDANDIAVKALVVFKQHCYRCHGQQFKTPGLNIFDRETMVKPLEGKSKPLVIPGDAASSVLWQRTVGSSRSPMPPKNQPRMTEAEKTIVTQWIEAGAPAFQQTQEKRPFVSETDVQLAILEYVKRSRRVQRKHLRFFTMEHLHNNPTITNAELNLFKAGLSKAINSLTWESEIVVPQAVDRHQTIFAIDMRDLDWTEEDHWNKLLRIEPEGEDPQTYPYQIKYEGQEFDQVELQIRIFTGNPLHRIRVRADWFVATATRPPLYNVLLELPTKGQSADDLEAQLEVTIEKDFLEGDIMRAATTRSNVSTHNRLLDRYRALHGAYWKSYDFDSDVGKSNLLRNPLGPEFDDNPFNDVAAFDQDGGEMVFTLPNHLNGYLLVDGDNNIIDEGPIQIVRDSNETSGSPVIVNGLSCMACHKNGFVRFKDDVLESLSVRSEALDKVKEIFPDAAAMNARLLKDEYHFLQAALQAVGPFLNISNIEELRDYPEEPVGAFARFYQSDMDLNAVAAELGYTDPNQVLTRIEQIPEILGPLRKGGVIKRQTWDSQLQRSNSGMQAVVKELRIAVPVN